MAIREINHYKFWSKLGKQAHRDRFPLHCMVELTYRCNHRCIHCYIAPEPKRRELNSGEVKNILDQLIDLGCFYIGFTGGEILLRADLFEILSYAKDKGFLISILTNGSLITPKIADQIKELNLNQVEISILGTTSETFDSITQVPGSFEQVKSGIGLLKERGQKILLKSCIMRPNIHEFDEIRKFSETLAGRGSFRFGFEVIPRTDGCKDPINYRSSAQEAWELEKSAYFKAFDRRGNLKDLKNARKVNRNHLFRCGAGRSLVAISPYGEMKLCLDISYPDYNLLEGSLKEGWKKIVEFVKNIKPTKDYKCASCPLFDFCSWCPAKGFLEAGDFNKCSPYHQQEALIRAKAFASHKLQAAGSKS